MSCFSKLSEVNSANYKLTPWMPIFGHFLPTSEFLTFAYCLHILLGWKEKQSNCVEMVRLPADNLHWIKSARDRFQPWKARDLYNHTGSTAQCNQIRRYSGHRTRSMFLRQFHPNCTGLQPRLMSTTSKYRKTLHNVKGDSMLESGSALRDETSTIRFRKLFTTLRAL